MCCVREGTYRVSQIFSVPSSLPLTSHFPSQCHAIEVILPECPSKVVTGFTRLPRPFASVFCAAAVASDAPLGLQSYRRTVL